jgi:hypothetical protein
MFRWLLILGAALTLVPLAPVLAGGPGNNPAPPPVSPRFGVVEAFYRPDDARALGVGWERIIFEWAQFQPDGPGEFDTAAVPDEWLLDAQRGGREVVGLIKNTPPWASDSHKLGAPPDGLDLPIDDPANVWAAFVQRLVKYYGETWGIRHWIIYNEPDLRPGEIGWYEFDGDATDYAHMLKVAYLAAKTANPDAVIHMAGMAPPLHAACPRGNLERSRRPRQWFLFRRGDGSHLFRHFQRLETDHPDARHHVVLRPAR